MDITRRNIANSMLLFLVIFQILDGIFTYIGVSNYGTMIEGNLFVKTIMEIFGVVFGLVLVKSISIFFMYFIYEMCKISVRMSVLFVLSLLNVFYFFVIFTWFSFLFGKGLV